MSSFLTFTKKKVKTVQFLGRDISLMDIVSRIVATSISITQLQVCFHLLCFILSL